MHYLEQYSILLCMYSMDLSAAEEDFVFPPMNPDIPEFQVVPPRLWSEMKVLLHDSRGPLGDSLIAVQVSTLLVPVENSENWIYSFKSWPIRLVLLSLYRKTTLQFGNHIKLDVHW